MNEIFVDARMRDWNETAEAIAYERQVRRILEAPETTAPRTTAPVTIERHAA